MAKKHPGDLSLSFVKVIASKVPCVKFFSFKEFSQFEFKYWYLKTFKVAYFEEEEMLSFTKSFLLKNTPLLAFPPIN